MFDQNPYDGYTLFATLGNVQQYLAELRYIDTAMQMMADEEAGKVQSYLGGLVRPNEFLDVAFGSTFPFVKRYIVPGDWYDSPFGLWDDTKSERLRAQLSSLATEAERWAAVEIEVIKERVRPYTWPQGARYDSECIEPIADLQRLLEDEVSSDFGKLKYGLSHWQGEAASNFANEFYYPFQDTVRSQQRMLAALQAGIASAKVIAEATQQSMMNVVCATEAALLEQLERAAVTAELHRQRSTQEALVITGAIAGLVASIFTAGTTAGLWAAGLTGAAGATQVASTAPNDALDSLILEGVTAAEIIDSLSRAILEIANYDRAAHEALELETRKTLDRLRSLRHGRDPSDPDGGRLIPMRPDLVDGVDGETFYLR